MKLSEDKRLPVFLCFVLAALLSPALMQASEGGPVEKGAAPEGMVFVRGGCFKMGDIFGGGEHNERPVREVCVGDFLMSEYEVTVGEFRKFVEDSGYKTEAEREKGCFHWISGRWQKDRKRNWMKPGFSQSDKSPAVCVSWNDAGAYIRWKNSKEGRRYRLPTEAEWEYAARSGGKEYKYGWGNAKPSGNVADETLKRELNWDPIWEGYDDGYAYTSPAGSFPPNEIGLFDMTGNVWEWVNDFYARDYVNLAKNNPKGPEKGSARVMRGGSWDNGPRDSRVFYRYWNYPSVASINIGFRLVISAE